MSTFVALDKTENVGHFDCYKWHVRMYHLIVKSICEETFVTVLSYWKVLALEIKYNSDI